MSPPNEEQPNVPPLEVASKMRMDYQHGARDLAAKALEALGPLLDRVASQDFDLNSIYRDCATMIMRDLGIGTVAICAWTPPTQQYRFKAIAGMRNDAQALYEKLWYTRKDALDEHTYPSHEISKQTKLYLSEDHPYAPGQEATFMRPGLIGLKRRSSVEALEADYLCTFFFGRKGDILGWIEYSGTRMGKLPDSATIRWVELAAHVLGIATSLKA